MDMFRRLEIRVVSVARSHNCGTLQASFHAYASVEACSCFIGLPSGLPPDYSVG
jgi:hypothetical protein